jgi:hypothetical protein
MLAERASERNGGVLNVTGGVLNATDGVLNRPAAKPSAL